VFQKKIAITSVLLLIGLAMGANTKHVYAAPPVKTTGAESLDPSGYDIESIRRLAADDIQIKGPWADPRAYGAIPDDGIDDTVAIQAALNTGHAVYLASGIYQVSSSLQIPAPGQHLEGYGGFGQAQILWTGGDNDSIIETIDDKIYHYVAIKNLFIVSNNDGVVGIDISEMSSSNFENLNISVKGNNTRGIWGEGDIRGDRPHYNYLYQVSVASDNIGGTTIGSVGIYFERVLTSETGNHNGANANAVIGGHLTGMDTGIIIADGIGNRFIGIASESIMKNHYEFGAAASDLTGMATRATVNSLTDSSQSMGVNNYIGGAITITGGTGVGQVRPILNHGTDTFTVEPYWTTLPDKTSTYEVVGEQGGDNSIYSPYCEGDSVSNPNFLKLHPGVLGTTFKGGMIGSLGTGSIISSAPLRTCDNLTPSSWKEPIPIVFSVDRVASSATNLVLKPIGVKRSGLAPLGTWHILGADVTVNGGISRGLGEIWVTANDVKITSHPNIRLTPETTYNAMGGSNTQVMFSTEELRSSSSYNHVGLIMNTDRKWAPRNLDIYVTLYVQRRR